MSHSIVDEARAFDERISERVGNGHVPDLRRTADCDWFFNNPWRRRYLAQQIFGEYVDFALEHLRGPRVLEVGAGPGHMSLELARHGFHVTGIDVSTRSIEVAQQVAAENPFRQRFGSVRYELADFMDFAPSVPFDNVCFFCSLHHFDEPERVVRKARSLLSRAGRIVVVEPSRDEMPPGDAAIVYMMRLLLSFGDRWHENLPIPRNQDELESAIARVQAEYEDAHDAEENEQSPHDNACGASRMLEGLRASFREIAVVDGFAFQHRMGGGLRSPAEGRTEELARFLYELDHYAVRSGLMRPGMVYWAGERDVVEESS